MYQPSSMLLKWTLLMIAGILLFGLIQCMDASADLSTKNIKPTSENTVLPNESKGNQSESETQASQSAYQTDLSLMMNNLQENPMLQIPATHNYDLTESRIKDSEFYLGDGSYGGPIQVALATFSINTFEITNQDYFHSFYWVETPSSLSRSMKPETTACSAYLDPDCTGSGEITARQAWNLALDLNDDGVSDREISFPDGLTLGAASDIYQDLLGNNVYTGIKGPGEPFPSNGGETNTLWHSENTPWLDSEVYKMHSSGADDPVVFISWYEARAYCKFVYGPLGDLPSEAQWERAAKGTNSADFTYPWGSTFNNQDYLWWPKSTSTPFQNGLLPVGSYETGKTQWDTQTPIEIYDMAGSVWEYTSTWHTSEQYHPSLSGSPTAGFGVDYTHRGGLLMHRVVRGGAWCNYFESQFHTAYRGTSYPTDRLAHVGFRCVLNQR